MTNDYVITREGELIKDIEVPFRIVPAGVSPAMGGSLFVGIFESDGGEHRVHIAKIELTSASPEST